MRQFAARGLTLHPRPCALLRSNQANTPSPRVRVLVRGSRIAPFRMTETSAFPHKENPAYPAFGKLPFFGIRKARLFLHCGKQPVAAGLGRKLSLSGKGNFSFILETSIARGRVLRGGMAQ